MGLSKGKRYNVPPLASLDRRGADVNGEAVEGTAAPVDLNAIEQDSIAVASYDPVDGLGAAIDGKLEGVPLDAHRTATHRVASHRAGIAGEPRAARQPECAGQVALAGAGGDRHSMPSVTSPTHSLHRPCLRHDVGTRTPAASAHSKREVPTGALQV